jgi:sugar lactone lactonase YvrE
MGSVARPFTAEADVLGESPVWIGETETLVWVDMISGAVMAASRGGTPSTTVIAPYVGAVVGTGLSDAFAVVTVDSVVLVQGRKRSTLTTILDDPSLRLNDAACDAEGRLWVGSTALDGAAGRGALHVWDAIGPPRLAARGLTQPNGIGWSPDGSHLYLVDTAVSTVFVAETGPGGNIGRLQALIKMGGAKPDGLSVDSAGCLWLAMWDGGELRQYSPTGDLLRTIRLPVSRPTSCAFSDDGRMFVTTARHGLAAGELRDQPWAGRVLELHLDVVGAPVGRLAT